MAGLTTYTIREARQSGWRKTQPAGDEHAVTLAPGEVESFRMFGNTRLGLFTGQKVNDTDGEGNRDASEPTLPGWDIYLDLNENAARDAREPLDVRRPTRRAGGETDTPWRHEIVAHFQPQPIQRLHR